MKLTAPACLTAVAALALAGQASAHSSVITCPATPGGPYLATNDPGYGTPTIAVLADGRLRLTWPDGYGRTVAAPTGCTPVTPPVPPVPEVVPPVTPPPVVVPPVVPPPVVPPVVKKTCAELTKANAGRKWLVKAKCATRLPVSCAVLRKVGAGPLTYARAGYYYRCAPNPVPRRTTPAVTG